jgi:hypothetical protein
MGSSMSGHTKQAYISHCKTMQMAENLRAKDAELLQTQWLIEEYEKMAAQDAIALKLCKHYSKRLVVIAILQFLTILWMAWVYMK